MSATKMVTMLMSTARQGLQGFLHRRWQAVDDEFDGFTRRIGDTTETDFVAGEHTLFHHVFAPSTETVPEFPADEHQRKRPDLVALDERCRLEQLIERAQSAGHD